MFHVRCSRDRNAGCTQLPISHQHGQPYEMNSTHRLHAKGAHQDPVSRRCLVRRRKVRVSTVALEHGCQDQHLVPGNPEPAGRAQQHQDMIRAVEAAWDKPSVPGLSAMDLQALSATSTLSSPEPVRARRMHKASVAASTMHPDAIKPCIDVFVSSSTARRSALASRDTSSSSWSTSSSSRSARTSSSIGLASSREEDNSVPAAAAADLGQANAELWATCTNLWRLYMENDDRSTRHTRQRPTAVLQSSPPRLLTASEEAALGSIIQQYRKLLQLYREQPDVAATLEPAPTARAWGGPTSSSISNSSSFNSFASGRGHIRSRSAPASRAGTAEADSSAEDSFASLSSSDDVSISGANSSRRGRSSKKVHGNTKWPPPLTADDGQEVLSMSKAWRAMLPELAHKANYLLVMFNVRLVSHTVRLCRRGPLPAEDLLAAGVVGLKKAAVRYDPGRKTRFSTIATRWILQVMQRTADEQQGSFRTPIRYQDMLRHVLRTYGPGVLRSIQQRPDVLQQVAVHFDTKPGTVLRTLQAVSGSAFTASLDAAYSGPTTSKGEANLSTLGAMLTSTDLDEDDSDDNSTGSLSTGLAGHGSFVASSGQLPAWMHQQDARMIQSEDAAVEAAAAQQVNNLLQALAPRERAVMSMLYGEDAEGLLNAAQQEGEQSKQGRPLKNMATVVQGSAPGQQKGRGGRAAVIKGAVSLTVVAEQLGLTVERVRQLRLSAFKRLQALVAAEQLADSELSAAGAHANSVTVDAAQAVQQPNPVEAAISQCHRKRKPFLRALHQYIAQHNSIPSSNVEVSGLRLGSWLQRQYKAHLQHHSLSAELLNALHVIAPDWQQQVQQQQDAERQQRMQHRRRKTQQPGQPPSVEAPPMLAQQGRQQACEQDCSKQVLQQQELQPEPEVQRALPSVSGNETEPVEHAIQQCHHRMKPLLRLLHQYYAAYGRIPGDQEEYQGKQLGRWCSRLHKLAKKGSLQEQVRDALEAVVPDWFEHVQQGKQTSTISRQQRVKRPFGSDRSFSDWLQDLREYMAANSDAMPPLAAVWNGVALGKWVFSILYHQGPHSLPHHQTEQLSQIPGWTWRRSKKFPGWIAELQTFLQQHGGIFPKYRKSGKKTQTDEYRLAEWLTHQRYLKSKGKLSAEKIAALEAVPGWSWQK